MKEYMFYIRNAGDAKAALSANDHEQFVKLCEVYISKLKAAGQLIAAQPIVRDGVVLSRSATGWNRVVIDLTKEVHVGYYHIRAKDLDAAVEIAQANPEFLYVPSASIEIHQIKTMEQETGFVYPNG